MNFQTITFSLSRFASRRTAAALAACLLSVTLARADAILFTHTQLFPNAALDSGVTTVGVDHTENSQRFINGFVVDETVEPVPGDAIMEGSAGATASFGTLSAYANLSLFDYAPGSYWQSEDQDFIVHASSGMAGFSDVLDIIGAPEEGGYLHFFFTADGAFSNLGSGQAQGTLSMQNFLYQENFATTGTYNVEFAIPFFHNTPLDIQVSLLASIFIPDLYETEPYSYTGSSDMAHTVTLNSILITDREGIQIPGAGITSLSNARYPVAPATGVVPEPATLILIGMGIGGMALRGRGLKRKA